MSSCHYTAIIASERRHLRNVGVNFEEGFGLGVGSQFGLHLYSTFFKGEKTGKAGIQLVYRTSCFR
jgi:hypothetical protein